MTDVFNPPRATEEVNPFVKRVVTVNPKDVVIFRYQGRFTDQAMCDGITAALEKKMGAIPFVVIDDVFDLTVLKQAGSNSQVHIA